MSSYYNEFDPFAAAWLRELIKAGHIAPGDVDDRSIRDVQPGDLAGYDQCHFFAGIGGWSYAARLAGWPDDRPLWTGSCPCQPFSVAGKCGGVDDPRHLWPDFLRLIRACRPPVVMGEQVAGSAGYGWFDGVRADLAREGYAGRGVDIPACAVDAPHIRNRLYWIGTGDLAHAGTRDGSFGVGQADTEGRGGGTGLRQAGSLGDGPLFADREGGHRLLADADGAGPAAHGRDAREVGGVQASQCGAKNDAAVSRRVDGAPDHDLCLGVDQVDAEGVGRGEGRTEPVLQRGRSAVAGADARLNLAQPQHCGREGRDEEGQGAGSAYAPSGRNGSFWSASDWIACHDGKARRTEPGAPLLAHGIPARVAKWRGFGNAIVPQEAAEVIGAFMDVAP